MRHDLTRSDGLRTCLATRPSAQTAMIFAVGWYLETKRAVSPVSDRTMIACAYVVGGMEPCFGIACGGDLFGQWYFAK